MKNSKISIFDFLEFYELKKAKPGIDYVERKIKIADEEIVTVHQYISTERTKIENLNGSIFENINETSLSKPFKEELIRKIQKEFRRFEPR